MSKFIKLWTPAIVNGVLRHTNEGVLHLEDDEADRLIANAAGEDVTSDFSAEQRKQAPVERVTVQTGQPTPPAAFDPAAEEGSIIAERQAAAADAAAKSAARSRAKPSE